LGLKIGNINEVFKSKQKQQAPRSIVKGCGKNQPFGKACRRDRSNQRPKRVSEKDRAAQQKVRGKSYWNRTGNRTST